MKQYGILFCFCGKMGAGKSTMARKIADKESAILISEDEWLSELYKEEINSIEDYIKLSSRLKAILQDHVRSMLLSGLNVVLDFPGNTKHQRKWFKLIIDGYQINHKMIFLDIDDDICLRRIMNRALQQPERAKFDTEETFKTINSYFQYPEEEEELNIEHIKFNA